MSEPESGNISENQTLPALPMRLILILALMVIAQALAVWGIPYITGSTPTVSIPGLYWLFILSSIVALPLVGLSLGGMMLFALVWIVRHMCRKPYPDRYLDVALILLMAAVGFCAAGGPSIFLPATQGTSLRAGSHMYYVASRGGLGDHQDVLFECDSSGIVCAAIYNTGDTCTPSRLTFDPSNNQVSLDVDGCGAHRIFRVTAK